MRASDFAARYGGEEFLVLLPDTDRAGAVEVAEKLRRAVERTEMRDIGNLTASFGIACLPEDAGEPEQLLRKADRALYAAKARGRNRVEVAAPAGGPPFPGPEGPGSRGPRPRPLPDPRPDPLPWPGPRPSAPRAETCSASAGGREAPTSSTISACRRKGTAPTTRPAPPIDEHRHPCSRVRPETRPAGGR